MNRSQNVSLLIFQALQEELLSRPYSDHEHKVANSIKPFEPFGDLFEDPSSFDDPDACSAALESCEKHRPVS